MLILLLLLAANGSHSSINKGRLYSRRATALRQHLMSSASNYDKSVVPESHREDGLGDAGTTVRMKVRFFKIDAVDPQTGSMQVKVWLRMRWQDTRLQWDPAVWNVTSLVFNHPEHEEPEIWLPEIAVYNSRQSVSEMFAKQVATVDHTGVVTYSRPGM
jgi:hypothetical protein